MAEQNNKQTAVPSQTYSPKINSEAFIRGYAGVNLAALKGKADGYKFVK